MATISSGLLHHYIQIMGQYKFVLGRILSEIKILKKLESGKKRTFGSMEDVPMSLYQFFSHIYCVNLYHKHLGQKCN